MRIVMLSDAETAGGAAIAASRLAGALAEAGHDVTRIVFNADGESHPWKTCTLRLHVREDYFIHRIHSLPLGRAARTSLISRRLDKLLSELSPDVISVHNLHVAFWPPELVGVCYRHAPVAWTLHDAWSFTGHCAYYYDCERFMSGCDGTCPRPQEYLSTPPGRIRGEWNERKRLLSGCPDIAAVTPSGWLAREAPKGLWKGHRIVVIPNGLDLGEYRPMDRTIAREALGIGQDSRVLIAAAESITDRRKGMGMLVEALGKVDTRPLTLVTFGRGLLPGVVKGVNVKQLGFVSPERVKVLAYNAADIMVHPASIDNLPNVVMEAIACGIPVVGLPTGGVPEMARPGITGWLADGMSSDDLAACLNRALADINSGTDLRGSCRAVAEKEYGSGLQAERYLELFDSLRQARQ